MMVYRYSAPVNNEKHLAIESTRKASINNLAVVPA